MRHGDPVSRRRERHAKPVARGQRDLQVPLVVVELRRVAPRPRDQHHVLVGIVRVRRHQAVRVRAGGVHVLFDPVVEQVVCRQAGKAVGEQSQASADYRRTSSIVPGRYWLKLVNARPIRSVADRAEMLPTDNEPANTPSTFGQSLLW